MKCIECGNEFEGRDSKFCSKSCYKKNWKKKNRERIKQQDKIYSMKNKEKRKIYLKNNKVRIKEVNKLYRAKNREKISKLKKDYAIRNAEQLRPFQKVHYKKMEEFRRNNPEAKKKFYATQKVRRFFIKYNPNIKLTCSICNIEQNIIKHHPDYDKPLEIILLCGNCHQRLHNKIITPNKLEIINLEEYRR